MKKMIIVLFFCFLVLSAMTASAKDAVGMNDILWGDPGNVGYMLGKGIDKSDATQVSQALETAPAGTPVAWGNAKSGLDFNLTMSPKFEAGGVMCRNVVLEASTVDGGRAQLVSRAYKSESGWKVDGANGGVHAYVTLSE